MEQIREHELHLQRISQIRGTVNNRRPRKPRHLKPQRGPKPTGKKEQIIYEKF